MFDSYLSGINDDHVENRLTKRMNNLQQAIDAFRDEYDRVLKDNLEMLNLDKIVRRKCDGATGVLRIKRCDDGSAVPSCYAFYRFKKDGLLAAKHSATCGSLVNEITLFYEPVTD
ncbi:hypothetical protein J6A31_05745 [bacterium]|nr:hypothetical protein [bacterium]